MKRTFRHLVLVLLCAGSFAQANEVDRGYPGYGGPGYDRGPGYGSPGYGPGRPGRPGYGGGGVDWVLIDEVHFRDGKTAVAIQRCKQNRVQDNRCNRNDYSCSPCSEVAHSDHSSYFVYQLQNRRTERRFIQTFHFRDNKTAVARQKCVAYRSSLRQCQDSRNFECTPCTVEDHTDHSQFDLYSLR